MGNSEICKRIGEIENLHGDFSTHSSGAYGRRYIDGSFTPYNPLADDALCFRLMIKHHVTPGYGERVDSTGVHPWYSAWVKGSYWCSKVKTVNKAICLAIIAKHGND